MYLYLSTDKYRYHDTSILVKYTIPGKLAALVGLEEEGHVLQQLDGGGTAHPLLLITQAGLHSTHTQHNTQGVNTNNSTPVVCKV